MQVVEPPTNKIVFIDSLGDGIKETDEADTKKLDVIISLSSI